YHKTNDTSAYFISIVLNPNVKIAYTEHEWDKESFDISFEKFGQVVSNVSKFSSSILMFFDADLLQQFDEYYVASISASVEVDKEQGWRHGQYGCSWMLVAVQARQVSDHARLNPCFEFIAYLKSPLEQTDDVVDYLSIQGFGTPSECAFSSGGLTGAKQQNCLNADVFESLQLLGSAYRNAAASDTEQHLDALIAALHENMDDDVHCGQQDMCLPQHH
ncbi:hypothetical protein BYT27DRAFT_7096914, partial [Phlegmacium glaucopus]